MNPFKLIVLITFLLSFGCDVEIGHLDWSIPNPLTNSAIEDQFNAIQGNSIQANILDNDELTTSYRIKESSIHTSKGFTVTIGRSGTINYSPPPQFTGRDSFRYYLQTLDNHGDKRFETFATVFLSIIPFRKTGILEDPRDGQQYSTIILDDGKVWMSENLAFDLEGSSAFSSNAANEPVYGRLYPWRFAIEACPEGWRLPTRSEVKAILDPNKIPLSTSYGMRDDNYHAHFEGGFSGLNLVAGGWGDPENKWDLYKSGRYWTGTPGEDLSQAYYYEVAKSSSFLLERDTNHFYACRCVKDEN